MFDKLQLTEYKQAIAESYDLRSHCYDDSDWQLQVCSQLLTYSQIESEQCILDIGTGTGHLAIGAVILKKVLTKYGVSIEPSNRIGSIAQCRKLFEHAGFESIDIKTHQHGSYATIERLKATWESIVINPSTLSLKDTKNHLSQLSSVQLAIAKAEFEAELEALQTDQGIWDDLTTLYVLARK